MLLVVLYSAGKIAGGVAILAAEQAAIVHADVFADHAAARCPLAGVFFVADFQPKGLSDVTIIHTFSRLDAVDAQVFFFGAGDNFHAIIGSGLGEIAQQCFIVLAGNFIVIDHTDFLLIELIDALADFGIHVHHADHRPEGVPV